MRQRFIQSFSTSGTEHQAIDAERLGKPYVAYIEDGRYIDWNTLWPTPPVPPEPVYSAMPLTFEIVSAGKINFKGYNTWLNSKKLYCSKDDGSTWTELTPTNTGTTINVRSGDKLIFTGNNESYGISNAGCTFKDSTAHFKVYGNIMSIVSGSGFEQLTTLSGSWNFRSLFSATHITEVKDLVLPATTLTEGCYYGMFGNTDITTSPVLSATTLTDYCYDTMFYGCTKLKTITCLATDKTASNCTTSWVLGVSASGTFIKNPDMNSWPRDENGIPAGWTVEDAQL